MRCIFCFNSLKYDNAISLNDKVDENSEVTAEDLIRVHFPFAEQILDNDGSICQSCWINVASFNEFYVLVANNYGIENLKDEDIILYEVAEKVEENVYTNNPIVKEEIGEDGNITEWITEAESSPEESTTKNDIEIIEYEDDQRIRDTANMLCDLCSVPLESLREAKAHFKHDHQTDGYLTCCNRKFKQRCRLLEHVNTHYNYSFPCTICGKNFSSKSYLTKHLACHEKNKVFQCDHCPKSFAKKFQIRNHLVSVHIFDGVEARFECPLDGCFKKFVSEARLKHHVNYTHASGTMEICEICSKSFKTKGALFDHKKKHSRRPEDRIKCEICGHYLSDFKSYSRHIKNHETESLENFCNYCGKKSPNLNALKKHIRYVHEMPRNFRCKYCVKTFKRPRNLMDHEASVHTLQDLYTCTFCPRTFRNQSNMLSHRKKKHPDKYQKPVYMRMISSDN